jgi:hypothetical protein
MEKNELPHDDRVHGEGNYEAARKYREAATKSAGSKQSRKAAKKARQAQDDPEERRALEKAEEVGKRRAGN